MYGGAAKWPATHLRAVGAAGSMVNQNSTTITVEADRAGQHGFKWLYDIDGTNSNIRLNRATGVTSCAEGGKFPLLANLHRR